MDAATLTAAAPAPQPVAPAFKTGIEIAKELAAQVPPPPAPGTRYVIAELTKAPPGTPLGPENSVVIVSPDGSIEDAVRVYNQDRPVRTAKQLRIQKFSK